MAKIARLSRNTVAAILVVGMFLLGFIGFTSAGDTFFKTRPYKEKILYVWAGDPARIKPDFLAVINFNENSPEYGKVIKTLPLPPPGNVGNEAHHCRLSVDKDTLACSGLLSLVKGQNGIFFYDVSKADDPKFLFSTNTPLGSINDDFLELPEGGFLGTQMGSMTGGKPGRVSEFDKDLNLVGEWPNQPPEDGFNPHGIDARPELNLLVTSDFINPVTSLNVSPDDLEVHSTVRVWDYAKREIVRTINVPGAIGTIDVKLIPGDPQGRGYTAGMFDGHVYLLNTTEGTAQVAFDNETIEPHIEGPTRGGLAQLLATPKDGKSLIVALFEAGQIVQLDTTDREHLKQLSVVNLGKGAGPHMIRLTDDDKRLVATDYFLNEDDFGKVHYEGDHKVHVLKVSRHKLVLDDRFDLDFDTAFPDGPARPHGVAFK